MPENENHESEQKLSPFAEKIAKIDEARWTTYQNLGGVVLGLSTGAILFLMKSDGSFLPMNFILALALAKFVPDYVEKQGGRTLRRARIVMIVVMLAAMLAYLGYIFLTQGTGALTIKK